ncbi:unnamed protein product, partial [Penicillium nalgiovense]
CCGWFSNLDSSSGAWDTRHCLLTGRSIGKWDGPFWSSRWIGSELVLQGHL